MDEQITDTTDDQTWPLIVDGIHYAPAYLHGPAVRRPMIEILWDHECALVNGGAGGYCCWIEHEERA